MKTGSEFYFLYFATYQCEKRLSIAGDFCGNMSPEAHQNEICQKSELAARACSKYLDSSFFIFAFRFAAFCSQEFDLIWPCLLEYFPNDFPSGE